MGTKYSFLNTRTDTLGIISFNHEFMSNINIDTFEIIISSNPDWLPTDTIKAYSKYDVITYNNGQITYEL
jgi:hypothetical protein